MIDPELRHYLSGLNQNLTEIKNQKSPGIWRAFLNGMFSAFGYVVGLALMVAVLVWILNATGLLPEFKNQVKDFKTFMTKAEKLIDAGQKQQESGSMVK